jgi:GT2 family glycosyltransferase
VAVPVDIHFQKATSVYGKMGSDGFDICLSKYVKAHLTVSVIIPTYNRKESLLRTLWSLSGQTLSTNFYEVIVVDDGSADATTEIATQQFPFALRFLSQVNSGATIARNHGALESRGDVLVFIDDDVTVSPGTLEALSTPCFRHHQLLVMATLIPRCNRITSVFTQLAMNTERKTGALTEYEQMHFAECNTQLLAVRRQDFFELGMLKDPTGGQGWPNWDDVEFGYRAYLKGYPLLRSTSAIGEHWDYSLADAKTSCRRWQRAAQSAVQLFKMHPGLESHIPMFRDKTPVDWRGDHPLLIARKMARSMASASYVLMGLEKTAHLLEQRRPSALMLRPLYRWIIGGYIFRGYREGLHRYSQSAT